MFVCMAKFIFLHLKKDTNYEQKVIWVGIIYSAVSIKLDFILSI